MLAEIPQVVYNNFRCEIESHCVGGPFACAGYGEVATPHSCRVVPASPKNNLIVYV